MYIEIYYYVIHNKNSLLYKLLLMEPRMCTRLHQVRRGDTYPMSGSEANLLEDLPDLMAVGLAYIYIDDLDGHVSIHRNLPPRRNLLTLYPTFFIFGLLNDTQANLGNPTELICLIHDLCRKFGDCGMGTSKLLTLPMQSHCFFLSLRVEHPI